MVGLGFSTQMAAGTSMTATGLAISATSPASLTINIGAGAITQLTEVDASGFGSLAADTNNLVKVGINQTSTPFTLTAPATSGQSINYLIEATFQEQDGTPVVLPYVNPSNPADPYSGPSNSGVAQNTVRAQTVSLQLLAGAAANAGTQGTPSTTAGWAPLYIITVNHGQTTITSWTLAPGAPFIDAGSILSAVQVSGKRYAVFASSGTWTCPAGVTTIRARMWAGGGGGGGSGNPGSAASGGGGGQYGEGNIPVTPGTSYNITVGAGGAGGGTEANGAAGGASAFSGSFSVGGGQPGQGANGAVQPYPGAGGTGGTGLALLLAGYGGAGAYSFGSSVYGGGTGGGTFGVSNTQSNVGSAAVNGSPGLYPAGGGGGGVLGGSGGNGNAGLVVVQY